MAYFDEKCKHCGTEMDQIHEDGRNKFGIDYIFWCPNCGTMVSFYDGTHPIPFDDEWEYPKLIKDSARDEK